MPTRSRVADAQDGHGVSTPRAIPGDPPGSMPKLFSLGWERHDLSGVRWAANTADRGGVGGFGGGTLAGLCGGCGAAGGAGARPLEVACSYRRRDDRAGVRGGIVAVVGG